MEDSEDGPVASTAPRVKSRELCLKVPWEVGGGSRTEVGMQDSESKRSIAGPRV